MFLGAAVTHYLIPETSGGTQQDVARPVLETLDCFNTGFFRQRIEDRRLEDLHGVAEGIARARQSAIVGWFRKRKKSP